MTCTCQPTLVHGETIHDLTCGLFAGLPIAPPKNAARSRVIFENQHYTACYMWDSSLIVTHKRKQCGKRMASDHTQFAAWIEAFETALDATESSELCRVFLK